MREVQSGSCAQRCTTKYINKRNIIFQSPWMVLVNTCHFIWQRVTEIFQQILCKYWVFVIIL